MIKTALTSLELRELAADCEKFNKTPPIESFEYQRLYLRITRYAPRCLGEAADELDRLSRIEDKYTNLCAVLNEQAGEIARLRSLLCKSVCELEDYRRWLAREKLLAPAKKVRELIGAIDSALEPSEHHVMDSIDGPEPAP